MSVYVCACMCERVCLSVCVDTLVNCVYICIYAPFSEPDALRQSPQPILDAEYLPFLKVIKASLNVSIWSSLLQALIYREFKIQQSIND